MAASASNPQGERGVVLYLERDGQSMNEPNRHAQEEPERSAAKVGSVVVGSRREAPDGHREAPIGTRPDPTASMQDHALGRPRTGATKPEPHTGFQRTTAAIRTVVPLMQKLLPLLDGNVASVVASLLAPRLLTPHVDLHPIEASVARLREDLAAIQAKNSEHDTSFKRIGDQLETMKEALESAAVEQKEVMLEVGRVQKRVLAFSLVGLSLLAISIALDVVLFVRFGQGLH
jgi:hypothetical protein